MYDMYPWDSASQGDYPPEPLRSRSNQKSGQKTLETSPARAVQIALDRRDNGGAPAAPAPGMPAAAAPGAHATPPTASLTRQ